MIKLSVQMYMTAAVGARKWLNSRDTLNLFRRLRRVFPEANVWKRVVNRTPEMVDETEQHSNLRSIKMACLISTPD